MEMNVRRTPSGFGLSSFDQSRSCVSHLRFRNEQCLILDPFGRAGGMVNVRFSFGRLNRFISCWTMLEDTVLIYGSN